MNGAYLSPGTVLRDRWEIGPELGRGGYSVVYLARDRTIDGEVAIKLLVPPPAAAEVARERMRREVQAVRGISHENIVAVYDFVEDGPWSFIVMEYVAGPDLSVRVRDRGPLGVDHAVRLGRDIASALGTAHRHGILHRDVKPQNVLLDPDGRFRLTDFGSARLDGQLGMTTTGALTGTPDYTAPEIVAGRRGDARADIFALGRTLFFALTGQLAPRHDPSGQESDTLGAHPRALNAAVPDWLDQVVARATAEGPDARYPTVAAMDRALGQAAGPALEPVPRCVLCDGPDPLGTVLCPACGGLGGGARALVFLRPERGEAPGTVERRLLALLPAIGADAAVAVRGERPLFRASAEGASRLVDQLTQRRLAAHAVQGSRILTVLPAGFYLMLVMVAMAGAATGVVAHPLLLWTTPLFVAVLLLSARREAATPLIADRLRKGELPPDAERHLLSTLAELPPGTARSLLADITRMGQALHGQLRRSGALPGAGSVLNELLVAASAAASDLAHLDAGLGRFENQHQRLASQPAGWLDALRRCERSRDALVQRLLEAMTVLGQLQGQSVDLGLAQSELAASIAELRTEADAHAAAAAEMAALLGTGSSDPTVPTPR